MGIESLNYFGTATNRSGHYFFQLGQTQQPDSAIGNSIRFNPEGLITGLKDGHMNLVTINGLNIIAIAGSPYDKRPGCKSVFWAHKGVRFVELKEAILTLPASKKIIEAMTFEINWLIG